MADLVAADVTYTINKRSFIPQVGNEVQLTIAFGDGVDTYPSGGVPLTAVSLGMKRGVIDSFSFDEGNAGDGFVYKYDKSANKIRMYQATPAGSVAAGVIAVTAGTTGDAVTNNAGVLESTGGQDLAVAAQTFTGTAGALTELSGGSSVVAATTLEVTVRGS